MVFKTEEAVYTVDELNNAFDFLFDLRFQHKDVGVVLGEAAHAHQTVKSAALFMTMDETEFAHADGQFSVTVKRIFVNEDRAGAVHRFDGVIGFVDLREVHIILIMIPMPGLFPQTAV